MIERIANWLTTKLRNWISGGDASLWHSDGYLQMQRYVNGAWEYRPASPDEKDDSADANTW